MPEAFGRNVIGFISKPFSGDSVEKCIHKAAFLSKDFYRVQIDGEHALLSQNIVYLQSEQKYTVFHASDGMNYCSRKSLKEWGAELEELGFCHISRSAVVNFKHLLRITTNEVVLSGNIRIRVSRRYLSALKEKQREYALGIMR